MHRLLIAFGFAANLVATRALAQSDKFMTEFGILYAFSSAITADANCSHLVSNNYVVKLKMEQQKLQHDSKRMAVLTKTFLAHIQEEFEKLRSEKWCGVMWERYGPQGTEMPHFLGIRLPAPNTKTGTPY